MAGEKEDYLEGQQVEASTLGSIKRSECRRTSHIACANSELPDVPGIPGVVSFSTPDLLPLLTYWPFYWSSSTLFPLSSRPPKAKRREGKPTIIAKNIHSRFRFLMRDHGRTNTWMKRGLLRGVKFEM